MESNTTAEQTYRTARETMSRADACRMVVRVHGVTVAQAADLCYARDAGYADYAALRREVPRGRQQTAGWTDFVRAVEIGE